MKVYVAIKRVIDPYVKVRVKTDGSGVETANVKMAMNPFCEIAVEEAIRLREAGQADEVVVISAGEVACQEQLRTALALGADRAIHIECDAVIEPLSVAKLLAALVKQDQPELIILGKQSIDTDNNQVAQMLSALLGYPQGTFASNVELMGDGVTIDGKRVVKVTREVDGGLETLQLALPAVLSTDLRLNEPRYASLPNIMKAKKKPLDVMTPEALGATIKNHQEVIEIMAPKPRSGGVKVGSVAELVDKLKNSAKVI
ncbi:electron transfer flavoprotein subunit beta/FixA family protein [Photobacterium gaetbulicola]|uniref:Electron transfer flavoprotein subunit beta n=1 Tax=Photobacterium gaetbulicola Gung47 TaxID=658445 RepID=A0A0C5WLA6_9GAMM|nr:electron transfer flavoprotein subunit beta/FixA family protein [Photobacterium gaetbulicola]AJR05859.1 putative electron transfer flavoprotein,beta subunit [Photobacterium gaetbulicola Gung47]PSU13324.1 electron transfer flavoprotein subunit beta/FixA family protein [Photobacterium gaetbulicola]